MQNLASPIFFALMATALFLINRKPKISTAIVTALMLSVLVCFFYPISHDYIHHRSVAIFNKEFMSYFLKCLALSLGLNILLLLLYKGVKNGRAGT